MCEEAIANDLPPLFRLLAEARDVLRLAVNPVVPAVSSCADGAGRPVMFFPGFLAADHSTNLIRRSLNAAGFCSSGWGLGLNLGARPDLIEQLDRQLANIHAEHGQKVILMGWSLGGLYARALAHHCPDKVAMVMTLGSPFSGSRRANRAWRLYEMLNNHTVDAPPLDAEFEAKPPVPTIAVWSRRDGIIPAGAACGKQSEVDASFEFTSTHMGYGGSPKSIRATVELLADQAAKRVI